MNGKVFSVLLTLLVAPMTLYSQTGSSTSVKELMDTLEERHEAAEEALATAFKLMKQYHQEVMASTDVAYYSGAHDSLGNPSITYKDDLIKDLEEPKFKFDLEPEDYPTARPPKHYFYQSGSSNSAAATARSAAIGAATAAYNAEEGKEFEPPDSLDTGSVTAYDPVGYNKALWQGWIAARKSWIEGTAVAWNFSWNQADYTSNPGPHPDSAARLEAADDAWHEEHARKLARLQKNIDYVSGSIISYNTQAELAVYAAADAEWREDSEAWLETQRQSVANEFLTSANAYADRVQTLYNSERMKKAKDKFTYLSALEGFGFFPCDVDFQKAEIHWTHENPEGFDQELAALNEISQHLDRIAQAYVHLGKVGSSAQANFLSFEHSLSFLPIGLVNPGNYREKALEIQERLRQMDTLRWPMLLRPYSLPMSVESTSLGAGQSTCNLGENQSEAYEGGSPYFAGYIARQFETPAVSSSASWTKSLATSVTNDEFPGSESVFSTGGANDIAAIKGTLAGGLYLATKMAYQGIWKFNSTSPSFDDLIHLQEIQEKPVKAGDNIVNFTYAVESNGQTYQSNPNLSGSDNTKSEAQHVLDNLKYRISRSYPGIGDLATLGLPDSIPVPVNRTASNDDPNSYQVDIAAGLKDYFQLGSHLDGNYKKLGRLSGESMLLFKPDFQHVPDAPLDLAPMEIPELSFEPVRSGNYLSLVIPLTVAGPSPEGTPSAVIRLSDWSGHLAYVDSSTSSHSFGSVFGERLYGFWGKMFIEGDRSGLTIESASPPTLNGILSDDGSGFSLASLTEYRLDALDALTAPVSKIIGNRGSVEFEWLGHYHFRVKYFYNGSTTPIRTYEVSAGGVADGYLVESTGNSNSDYPAGFEVVSVKKDGSLWGTATIIGDNTSSTATRDEFARVDYFSNEAITSEFTKYFIDGIYDPVAGTHPFTVITKHSEGDEVEDRYVIGGMVPPSVTTPAVLPVGHEDWEIDYSDFSPAVMFDYGPFIPVGGLDVGSDFTRLYSEDFLAESGGADWKHLPFWRYPKTRSLNGTGWARDGEEYTYNHDGSLLSRSYSTGGMDATDSLSRDGNQVEATEMINDSTLSTTETVFPGGLTMATRTVDGLSSSIEYYSSGVSGGLPWNIKASSSPGGETSYTYAKETNGDITTVETFDPADGGSDTVTTTVINKFGMLVSQKVKQGSVEILSLTATGHASNPFRRPIGVVVTSAGVTRTMEIAYHPDGSLKKVDDGNGTVNEFKWDLLSRIASGSKFDGHNVTPNYGGFTNSVTVGSDTFSSEEDEYGKLQEFSDTSGAGFSVERLSGNKFKATVTSENRSFNQDHLADGSPSNTGGGLGSPGANVSYSVANVNGVPCIAASTTLVSSGNSTGATYTRYYDGRGRLRRVSEPHPMGSGFVNTNYSYNMTARTVTVTPPAPSKPIVIQYSTGWTSATITQGGAQYQVTNTAVNGIVSILVTNSGRNVFSSESSLGTGATLTKVNGRNAVSTTTSADGNTLSVSGPNSLGFDAHFNRYGLTGMSGSVGGQNFDAGFSRDGNGQVSAVAVDPPGPRSATTTTFSPGGRPTGATGGGTNLALNYNYSGGGVAVTGSDTATSRSFAVAEDAEGNLKSLSATGRDQLAIDGKVLEGGYSLGAAGFAGQSVNCQFSPAGYLLGKTRTDGSGISYVWNGDGSLASFNRFDGAANGSGSHSFSMTRDSSTGFLTGYIGSDSSLNFTPNNDGTVASAQYNTKDAAGVPQLYSVQYPSYFDDAPLNEVYGGLLSGYEVKRNYNPANGEITRVELYRNSALVHAIDYTADGRSQVGTVTASVGTSFSATYGYPSAFTETLTAGAVTATRTTANDGTGNLTSVTTGAGGDAYSAVYGYNSNHQRKSLTVTVPDQAQMVWNYGFENATAATGQLQSATLTQGSSSSTYTYNHNAAGNRGGSSPNNANQYSVSQAPGARTVTVEGHVQPGATIAISHGGATLTVLTQPNGSFSATFPAPVTGSSALSFNFEVVATLPGAGDGGANAVAAEQRTVVLSPTTQSLSYGAHGALASDWRWNYLWNSEGNLQGMETRPAAMGAGLPNIKMKFAYDDLGRRIRKQVDYWSANGATLERSVVTKFVYDGWRLLVEQTDDTSHPPTIYRYFTWGKDLTGSLGGAGGVGGLLAIHQDGLSYVPIYDGNGNIIALAEASNGTRVAAWNRGPFGEPISSSGNTDLCPFGFATQYTDAESGLVYFGYRYYSPTTGRWISREPLGETESFNLYAYCHNDPVNKIDALGLEERVISGSEPVIFTSNDDKGFYIGWPIEDDGLFRDYSPTGEYYISPLRLSKGELENFLKDRKKIVRSRTAAYYAYDGERLGKSIRHLEIAQFYVANGAQAIGGFGEAAGGAVLAPASGGVTAIAVIHGADVTTTAIQRLVAGPGIDIQSNTSLLFQQVGFDRRAAEFGDSALSFAAPASEFSNASARVLTVLENKFMAAGTKIQGSKGLGGAEFEDWIQKRLGGTGGFYAKNGRQIDGILPDGTWYEAKGGLGYLFDDSGNIIEKRYLALQNQLGNGSQQAAKEGAAYEVFFNDQLPLRLIDWLEKKGIKYTILK